LVYFAFPDYSSEGTFGTHIFQGRVTISVTRKAGRGDRQGTDKPQIEQTATKRESGPRAELPGTCFRAVQCHRVGSMVGLCTLVRLDGGSDSAVELEFRFLVGFFCDIFNSFVKEGVKVQPETFSAALTLIMQQDCQATSLPPYHVPKSHEEQ